MVNLKNVGLNAPAPQDGRTKNIVANFEAFSKHLLQNGIPISTVNAMREQISKFTNAGKDPGFKIVDKGIIIEGKLFELNFSPIRNPEQGLGFIATGAAAMAGGKALIKMLPPDFLGNTFGSVFANGFDLSCWGASFSESKATAALEVDMPYMVGEFSGLENAQNTSTLNKYLNGIEGYILASVNGQNKKYASCTRKGWAIAQKGAEGAKKQVLDSIRRGFNITPTGKKQGGLDTSMPSREGGNFKWGEHGGNAYMYESFRIDSKKGNGSVAANNTPTYQQPVANTYQQPVQQTTANNYQEPVNNTTANINPNNATPSKSNTGLIIGGVALASIPLLFMMKSKDVKEAVSKAKKPVRKALVRKAPVKKSNK